MNGRRKSLNICCRVPARMRRSGSIRKVATTDEEPILGQTYLPRKFKTTVVIPPQNDIDLHANDMNFVAIAENGKLVGFNLLVGGGLSIEHGNKKTYARTASEFGYLPLEHTTAVAEAVVTTQRDWGNRTDRKMPKPNTRWSAWVLRHLKRKWNVARGSNSNRSARMNLQGAAIALVG